MFDIAKAFDNSSESVSDFFQRPGVGFYIPLYQRDYSWSKENIDQLMQDICDGVHLLVNSDKNDNSSICFLGTIILLLEKDTINNIKPQDYRALPEKIYNVIDGQQRISTLALLACRVYEKLFYYQSKFPKDSTYDGLKEAVNRYKSILLELFSVDLKRGIPEKKPIIIRGQVDSWTFDGLDNNYQSGIAHYLSLFIRKVVESENSRKFPILLQKSLVRIDKNLKANLRAINSWLNKVETSHQQDSGNDDFPAAWYILDKMPQKYLWSYDRPEIVEMLNNCRDGRDEMTKAQSIVCSTVQLLALSYYLLERCCFTLIKPKSEDWAFDMFQSLNATGTPLTALETFKPLVVNFVSSDGTKFEESVSGKHFAAIDLLFSDLNSASAKNKLTNDYLNLLGLTYDGGKQPSRQFSSQRRWLTEKYKECVSLAQKENFTHRMAHIATYWNDIVKDKDPTNARIFEQREYQEKRKEAVFCILYLQDASHKMANTVLSRFYSLYLRNQHDNNAAFDFMDACKVVAAFFTLWRSALPNTGLDQEYRKLLQDQISWQQGDSNLSVPSLKQSFKNVLENKQIAKKEDWKRKAIDYLRFDNSSKSVCKFALTIASNDTIPDPDNIGLMKIGRSGSSLHYLDGEQWKSRDLKTIEHIAPQNPDNDSWDRALYTNNEDYQQIGNLTLLPTDINSSAGNKIWVEKWIYYSHLAETDPQKLDKLKNTAQENGVNLDRSTIKLLKEASYAHHIKSIVQVGPTGTWDKALVERRTERICDILWECMNQWLTE
ncbi:DUF262 domain-containing protein [Roseofilum casamattae]|uniref:DUF262 domain-containing HNH endonuclease family protein n=1 Tax=Roseofilum casamattae BLCC-M143 TaxID=3022442 RepID=A0ABT7BUE5_9CYAN|nr:DUF262 domain-containing HNH endonuclease family protein [Roseofilum casamattae]MDJ1182808.1 DUF262 domain-containing HNH endonuclease family protein [Roseofilum casamattae BLCC-M143]